MNKRRFPAFKLTALAFALVAVAGTSQAQRAARGGFSAPRIAPSFSRGPGFQSAPSVRSSPSFSPGFSQRSTFRGPANRPPLAAQRGYAPRTNGYNVYNHDPRRRQPYAGEHGRYNRYGIGYGVTTWLAPDYIASPNDSAYDDSYDAGATQAPDYLQAPVPEPDQYDSYSQNGGYIAPAPRTPPTPEETVTLIFKDGRPPEQVQNYLMTRTTLTVFEGQRQHDIPVADLDMAATVNANRNALKPFKAPQ